MSLKKKNTGERFATLTVNNEELLRCWGLCCQKIHNFYLGWLVFFWIRCSPAISIVSSPEQLVRVYGSSPHCSLQHTTSRVLHVNSRAVLHNARDSELLVSASASSVIISRADQFWSSVLPGWSRCSSCWKKQISWKNEVKDKLILVCVSFSLCSHHLEANSLQKKKKKLQLVDLGMF